MKIEAIQLQAEESVRKRSLHLASDAETLADIERFYDSMIVLLVGSWRTVAGCLPSMQHTGGSRKNIWSPIYAEKAREYRTMLEVCAMWARQASKEKILKRLNMSPSLTLIHRSAPTASCSHVE